MNKTIGMLAHVDAGKTTFSEQLLYHAKAIKQRGRVDHKDAFLDSHPIEKQRGITVFSGQGIMHYNDSQYYIIDTPGHVDFSPEMERSIQVMDYAIIIVSAVEGIEGHTETVWQLLRKYKVPTFFFINKVDRVGADVNKVMAEIKDTFTKDVCDITNGLDDPRLVEFIAERDEVLFHHYLEEGHNLELWRTTMIEMIQNNTFFPCASGSALQDTGIKTFLKMLDQLTESNYAEDKAFSGRIYRIRHEKNGNKIAFIKALNGTLRVRDEVSYGNHHEAEKVTQLRVYNGDAFHLVNEVSAGELFAVTGLSEAAVGDGIGFKEKAVYGVVPTLKSKVIFDVTQNPKEALHYFQMLEAEDPSLRVQWEESSQEIHIQVSGTIQLEVLQQLVLERFGLTVSFGEPDILYKETIDSETIGYGHFEPLKHYAEVHLKIEPSEPNSGITFENTCHVDDLTIGNQNLIRHHLFEREHHGLLTGSPVTDVKITLLTGRAHNKHTSGGDFREATYRALRQGLEKVRSILLEPYYSFKIKVKIDEMGKVLSDIESASGSYDTPMTEEGHVWITGKAPVATFMYYPTELASYTQGKGRIKVVFGGYFPCHNEEDVVKRIGYNKDSDPAYSSSSIFCSKGKGYSVPWDQAEKEMHCL